MPDIAPRPEEDREPSRLHDDIEHLNGLPAAWLGLDPTSIAESVLETLRDMLALDFVGLRFNDTTHVFLRVGQDFGEAHSRETIVGAVDDWLEEAPSLEPALMSIGRDIVRVVQRPLGGISSMGLIVAGSRRPDFPRRTEQLKLDVAAAQASLACREVRELSDRRPPADPREERPTGETLVESEWRLNLTINTMPAMAWSTTPDGLIDFCNRHFLDYVGYTHEELSGQGFWPIFHPDDTAHLLASWQEIMASKRPREVEGRIRRADGEYRWFMMRQNPLLDDEGAVIKWYGVGSDIEDRKRAETALKETESALLASEQNLSLIINSLPVLVWSARPDGTADFVNERWIEYAGVPAEQILEWGFLELYHPDDVAGMLETWQQDIEKGESTVLKGRILGADGQYRWFLFAGRKLTDANGVVRWFGCNVDIEDLQRAENALKSSEAALRESERRLQHAINAIPGLVWSADADGTVTFLSQQYLNYIGLSEAEALGRDGWASAAHADDFAPLFDAWNGALASGRATECEARMRGADGEYRWFLFRASPFHDDAGHLTQWFGVNIDIDDRKRAEENFRQSQSDLAHVARMTTMGELAVSIAHEVNQPLMAIVTNAGACLRWLDDAQSNVAMAREAAERIIRDGHRAGDIVTSLRALARKSAPRMERMGLEQVIQDVLDLLRGELQRRGVTCKTEFSRPAPTILGDSTQLQQVVLNLIMNGIEAMARVDGGQRRLTIRTEAREGAARVCVLDTGPGLSPEHRDRMFEAFFSTKPEGIGMGLSICRSIIEAHGGRIWAANATPRGGVFSFTLPLAEGDGLDVRSR
ncbi:PAS domain S-box protein [Caulobacter segnis]|uniref:PAS domain-containing sensor histidine kinase n=1 Tax=Caulobacter segnis TaxID=88688 RepID=UPI001CBD5C7C|nr:PAS domain S-box protein [Caulobacter segnis]UAL12413.1 PAS domain S-box protein [Caulobacter segnis]